MFLPRAPIVTPGYFSALAKGSGGQSARRWSIQQSEALGVGPVGASKHGSLTSPR